MKLYEIGIVENEFMDLSLKSHMRPEDDINSKQSPKHKRKPVLTLKHINKLKRMKYAQQYDEEKRKILLNLMYGTSNKNE